MDPTEKILRFIFYTVGLALALCLLVDFWIGLTISCAVSYYVVVSKKGKRIGE